MDSNHRPSAHEADELTRLLYPARYDHKPFNVKRQGLYGCDPRGSNPAENAYKTSASNQLAWTTNREVREYT